MGRLRVLILRAAGTNCDLETEHAWSLAGVCPQRVHLRQACDDPTLLRDYQILTIPGGFSFGDDVAAGRIFAAQLQRSLGDELARFFHAGKLILGICNGFQVLVRMGLLPYPDQAFAQNPRETAAGGTHAGDAAAGGGPAARGDGTRTASVAAIGDRREMRVLCTLAANEPSGFQDRWVALRAEVSPCVFTEPGVIYEMPIAHGEGRVAFRDDADLQRVLRDGLGVLRYVDPLWPGSVAGSAAASPANPNGSAADLAGLCDPSGRIFGLMPHPDRFVTWTQHPCWTSLPPRAEGDGLAMFRRAVAHFR